MEKTRFDSTESLTAHRRQRNPNEFPLILCAKRGMSSRPARFQSERLTLPFITFIGLSPTEAFHSPYGHLLLFYINARAIHCEFNECLLCSCVITRLFHEKKGKTCQFIHFTEPRPFSQNSAPLTSETASDWDLARSRSVRITRGRRATENGVAVDSRIRKYFHGIKYANIEGRLNIVQTLVSTCDPRNSPSVSASPMPTLQYCST